MSEDTAAISRHGRRILVRGWYLDDLRVRAESSAQAECGGRTRRCFEPEVRELAEFVTALIDIVEALDVAA